MPSLFACLGCGGKGETDDIKVLDYKHAGLNDVPGDVFASERTLEELYLDSNQLKELPRQLFYCHGLRVLGLSDNEISAVPPAVASLINLHTLDLSKNSISDIPDNIKGCKQLSVVDASINPLCRLPEGFTQLLHLSELYLNDTFLEYLPANFGRLSRLRILELRENQLNTLPKSMARLTQLQRLDIGQNDFSELPEVIGSLVNLTELWFDNNKVKCVPPMIGKLTKLQHLDATKNKVDGISAEIHNCTLLTDLNLSSNNLKELPEALGGCKNMQVLRLDDNAITHLPESLGSLAALEELVLTQNDIEVLPSSVGLLRVLHTLHLDDNLLAELPNELGSCSRLSVLTASSNQLSSVPAELGHLQRLAVLNLCNNLINNLPVSLSKLKLRALWLSDNQNKPTVNLQSETDPETGQRVLTCFMLPQHAQQNNTEYAPSSDNIPADWEEQRRRKSLIKFATDGETDKPGNLRRAPTPYPKELKALAKHARNVYALGKGDKQTIVLPESKNKNNNTSMSSQLIKNDSTDAKNLNTDEEPPSKLVQKVSSESSPLLARSKSPIAQIKQANKTGTEAVVKQLEATKLAVLEKRFSTSTVPEERPLLHETPSLRSANESGESAYTIGDKKMFGQAQVVATGKTATATTIAGLSKNSNISPAHSNASPAHSISTTTASNNGAIESNFESIAARIKKPPPYHIAATFSRHAGDFETNSSSNVEVNNEINNQQRLKDLSIEMAPLAPVSGPPEDECNDTSSSSDSGYVNSRAGTNTGGDSLADNETSELGTVEECSTPSCPPSSPLGSTLASTPSSPSNTLPPSPTKSFPDHSFPPTLSSGPASPVKSYFESFGMPESPTKGPLSPMKGLSSSINLDPPSPAKIYNNFDVTPVVASPVKSYHSPSPSSPSKSYNSEATPAPANLSPLKNLILDNDMDDANPSQFPVGALPTRSPSHFSEPAGSPVTSPSHHRSYQFLQHETMQTRHLGSAGRPASIATSAMNSNSNSSGQLPQRPGSLALGALAADTALLNTRYNQGRPGSLAAPCNTLGIPPAPPPARAISHMGINIQPGGPMIRDQARSPHFRSQDLSPQRAWSPLSQSGISNGGGETMAFMTGGGETMAPMPPEEPLPMAGGLVSIIDQVASGLLDEAESPRDKPVTPTSPTSPYSPTDSLSQYTADAHSTRAPTTRIPQPSHSPKSSITQEHPHDLHTPILHTPKPHTPIPHTPIPHTPTINTPTDKDEPAPRLPPRNETSHIYSGSSINGEAKPESRIPTKAVMNHSPNNLSNVPQNDTRIPMLGSVGRSPSNLDKNDNETHSRIPTMDAMVKSPSSVYSNTGETRIPSLASMGKSLSNLSHSSQSESRLPTMNSSSRIPSTITSPESSTDSRIPQQKLSLEKKEIRPTTPISNGGSHISSVSPGGSSIPALSRKDGISPSIGNGGSGIPSLASSGRSRSSLSKESAAGLVGKEAAVVSPTSGLGNGGSHIPTLGSMGRTLSSLGRENNSPTGIPSPATPTSGLPSYGVNRNIREGSGSSGIIGSGLPRMNERSETPNNEGSKILTPGNVAPTSRILSPGSYSSGIRPPPPASSMQSPGGYSPVISSAINTPGIPLPQSGITSPLSRTLQQPTNNTRIPAPGVGITSPLSSGGTPTSRLPGPPGPRGLRPPTPTTALTKIGSPGGPCLGAPSVSGGGGTNKIGSPSPSPPLLPPGNVSPPSSSSPAWMFGQHKNARVFPVVVEKNPGLGFTIGQSHGHPDGKNIYVSSVAEGGPASSALKPGDKILQIDGREMRSVDLHMATSILNANAGTISLMVSRLA